MNVQIITYDGISLDLNQDAEFSIEYENPMLDDGHIPVPFSTAISFLPTPANRKAFGYLGMTFEPSVKSLGVEIIVSGVLAFDGKLEYDSIEDGMLNYTFVSSDPETDWSKKLWQLDIYKDEDAAKLQQAVAAGNVDGVTCPLMVLKSAVADTIYNDDDKKMTPLEYSWYKYINCPVCVKNGVYDAAGTVLITLAGYVNFFPVVELRKIIESLGDIWSSAPDTGKLAIIGTFSKAIWAGTASDDSFSTAGAEKFNEVARSLPDVAVVDIIRSVAKMKCAAVYRDGSRYSFMTFSEVLEQSPVNLDGKISDEYSLSRETAQGYSISYEDDEDTGGNRGALENSTANSEISEKYKLLDVIGAFGSGEYEAVMFSRTGDIYSGKSIKTSGHPVYISDIAYHNTPKMETGDSEDSVFSQEMCFSLVRALPEVIYDAQWNTLYRMSPVIDAQSADADRSSKVYLGYAAGTQMSDSGFYFGPAGQTYNVIPLTKMDPLESIISPEILYQRYHKAFAKWLSRDRVRVSVRLNLSPLELNDFRMYRRVYFYGRTWIPAKIGIVINTDKGITEVSGEFISYDDVSASLT